MSGPLSTNPLEPFLDAQGVVILDGGLATELEARGEVLGDDLWSAKLLQENPSIIRQVHLDYLRAGADCLVSASYQATFEGFARRGLSDRESEELLRRSVTLALDARDRFWSQTRDTGRLRPLVAASIGPYGAFLADGSEYSGDYGMSAGSLREFHRRRFEVLADSGADLLACETIPSLEEARALCQLLETSPAPPAWMTFSCSDGRRICDGTPFSEALAVPLECPQVIAVGVNCTAPKWIAGLLGAADGISKPLVAYPNSGEDWDPIDKRWVCSEAGADPVGLCTTWRDLGAALLGGCCRTTPDDIRAMRSRLIRLTPTRR